MNSGLPSNQNLPIQQPNTQSTNPLCFNTNTQRVCLSVTSLQNNTISANGQDNNGPIPTQGVIDTVARFLGFRSTPTADANDLF